MAERIRERMREKGFVKPDGSVNVHMLAEKADLAYGTVYPIVHGISPYPRPGTLEALASALMVDPLYLLYGETRPESAGAFHDGVRFALGVVRDAVADAERLALEKLTSGAPGPDALAEMAGDAPPPPPPGENGEAESTG